MTSVDDETSAIEAFRNGEVAGLEWLAAHYMRSAVAVARGLLPARADAEDIAQEAFVRAWKKRSFFRSGDRFGPWLFRIIRNLSLDLLKHRRRAGEESLGTEHVLPVALQPDSVAGRQEAARRIRAALDALPPMQRLVAWLYLVEGFGHAEIARSADLSEGTVRSHLSLARARLREALHELWENGL